MIAYKFVIKENNSEYSSLMEYGIDGGKHRCFKCHKYKIGELYKSPKNVKKNLRLGLISDRIKLDFTEGYHFFKENNPEKYNGNNFNVKKCWKEFLERENGKELNFVTLKCNVSDVKIERDNRIIANKFKIIEEVN